MQVTGSRNFAGDYNYALERDQKGAHARTTCSSRVLTSAGSLARALDAAKEHCGTQSDAQSACNKQSKAQSASKKLDQHRQPTNHNKQPEATLRCIDQHEEVQSSQQAALRDYSGQSHAQASASGNDAHDHETQKRQAAAEKHYAQGYAMRKAVRTV